MGGETRPIGMLRWVRIAVVGRNPRWTLVRVAVIIVAAYFLVTYVVAPIRIEGTSMAPTYTDKGIKRVNFINRLAYLRHGPQRGDVVGIRLSGERLMYMKRVVGLPGERVSFVRGRLHINGEEIEEPYVKSGCDWNMREKILGADEFYVVGDNRGMAMAGHTQGVALRRKIVGKVIFGGNS